MPIDKETKVSPFGQTVAQVGTSVWGGEGTPFIARVLFERLGLRSGLCGTLLVSRAAAPRAIQLRSFAL